MLNRKYKHLLFIILTGCDSFEPSGPNNCVMSHISKASSFAESHVELSNIREAVISKMTGTQKRKLGLYCCGRKIFVTILQPHLSDKIKHLPFQLRTQHLFNMLTTQTSYSVWGILQMCYPETCSHHRSGIRIAGDSITLFIMHVRLYNFADRLHSHIATLHMHANGIMGAL